MSRGFKRVIGVALALALALALAAQGARWWLDAPLSLRNTPVELEVTPGMTPRQVAAAVVASGAVTQDWALYAWFRASGEGRRIRAGNYEIAAGTSPRTLLRKLVDGDETVARVRFIEGWTLRQVRQELAKASGLRAETTSLTEAELMALIGASGVSAEGRFFPDTYTFTRGTSDLLVLKRAYAAMDRHLQAAWAMRAADTPLASAQEALVLASIIEKETGRAQDRGRIAGVFANRLRIGMPLQTDPSIIYGMGTLFDGNLRKKDLLSDGPYNTYTRKGLPPTPIALPGLAALQAAVQPEPTSALYFVASGDGGSVFSDSLTEHNRAVQRYQRQSSSRP